MLTGHVRAAICTWIVAAGAACLLACGGTPTQPAPVQPPAITGLRISGPSTIAPGATVQFTAIAQRADGSSEDVTAIATWFVLDSHVLRFTGPGTAQAGTTPGGARVNAQLIPVNGQLSRVSQLLPVLVLEPGTFRISGTVTEAGGAVIDAAIEIVSGTGTGLRATTAQGHYALYGAAGDVQLRASRDGFEQQVHRLVVTDNVTDDFDLRPLVAPADLSGSWILTLSAASSCRANLPEVARAREFDARITQQGTHFYVTLASPTIYDFNAPSYDGEGRIFGQALSFVIPGDTAYDDWSYPEVFDRLSPTQWLGISGFAQGTVTGSEIRGTLDTTMGGAFDYWESLPTDPVPAGRSQAVCHAKDNSMVLRRR